MNLWIVTIGSSDIQLASKKTCKDKGLKDSQLSHKVWGYWCSDEIKEDYRLPFPCDPKPAFSDIDEPYKVGARILGTVYKANDEELQQEIWGYLTFPLLDNFVRALQKSPAPEVIAVLLTDQSELFADDNQRRKPRVPYWQDTCELKSILEKYFQDMFSGISCEWIYLDPKSEEQRLDNWDEVLKLVDIKFSAHFSKELSKDSIVYVSHQAGTPAISSAVQFSSLAKFGDRTRFLVSSEQNTKAPEILPSSSYLKGIRKQEATTLLGRPDYPGIQALIEPYLKDDDTKILLNAAIQWNHAKFDEFAVELQKLSDQELAKEVKERSQHYWWIAYEEVYLAINRKNQGNIVEAFFHSFRAFEGIFAAWGYKHFEQHIESFNGIPYLNHSILEDTRGYFSNLSGKDSKKAVAEIKSKLETLKNKSEESKEEIKKEDRVELNLLTLCKLFKAFRYADYKQNCQELKIFWDDDKQNNVSEKRNFVVHQVKGMSESNLWEFWGVLSLEEWEMRLLKFLNFIAKEDILLKPFESLGEASMMMKVHKKLKSVIPQL
jgi:hypothetical protein